MLMSFMSGLALRDKKYIGILVPVSIGLLGLWYKRRHPTDSIGEDLVLGASPATRRCLWCNESFEAKYPRKNTLYCSGAHAKLGKVKLKWNLAGRSSRSGISGDTLGKMMRVLRDKGASVGYTSGGWIEGLHGNYKVASRRLHPSGITRLIKIYIRDDVVTVTKEKGKTIYKWKKGNSLKDWLKPKYVDYLETNFSAEDEDKDPDEITQRPQKGSGPHYCDVCGYNYGREIMIKGRDPKPTTTCLCEIKARRQREEDESEPGDFAHRLKTLREEGGLSTNFYDEDKPTSHIGDYPVEEPTGAVGASRRKENWPPYKGMTWYDNIGEQHTFWKVPSWKHTCIQCGGGAGGLISEDDGTWICPHCDEENQIAWWAVFGGPQPKTKQFGAEERKWIGDVQVHIDTIQQNIAQWTEEARHTGDPEESAFYYGAVEGMTDILAGLENVGLDATLEEVYMNLIPRARNRLQEIRVSGDIFDAWKLKGVLTGYKETIEFLSPYPPAWSIDMAAEDIDTYRGKRKAPTPEPGAPGTSKKSTGPPMKVRGVDVYSVQEHHAEKRGAHRDIRIGYDDPTHGPVLLSFVPTGGLDNKIPTKVGRNHKITTIKTEDHPFDYWYFEGSIPSGSYGAGPVSLETYGNCNILAYEPGKKLKVEFTGGKYPGKYVFIHYRGKVWGMWRYE